jgi:hypothetical protein
MPLPATHRASLVLAAIAASLTVFTPATRAQTTAGTGAPIQLVPNSEHTEPDVHTVRFVQQTIEVKTNNVTTVSFETNTIVDAGKLVVGDLIIDPPVLTLATWNTGIDPLALFAPQQEPIVVATCDGSQYSAPTKSLTVDLKTFKEGKTHLLDLAKKSICNTGVNDELKIIYSSNPDCKEMRLQELKDGDAFGGLSNLGIMLDIDCAPTPTPTSGGPPPTPTWTSNGSTPTATATQPRVRVVMYPSGPDEVTVRKVDSVDPNLETSFQTSRTAIDDVVHAFDNFILAIVGFFDFDPPVLTVSGNQTVEAVGAAGAPAFFVAQSRDVDLLLSNPPQPVDPAPLVVCVDQTNGVRFSGSTFGLGLWTVTCITADHKFDLIQNKFIQGNVSAPKSFQINVVDTKPPVISGAASQMVGGAGPSGAIVNLAVTAHDAVSGSVGVTCNPASGTQFPLGTTSVSCTAADNVGNTSPAFLIAVTVLADTPTGTATSTATATATATTTNTATVTNTATATCTATSTATATVTATPTNTPLALGAACTGAGDCASAKCEDGVCCDRACSDTDQVCNRPGDEGTCVQLTTAPAPALSLASLAIALATMALLARRALRKRRRDGLH